MTPADKLQKTSGCWSKSAGNWAKRIPPVYGFSKVLTLEYTGSSCNFNELHCLMQSDMILVHAIIIQCKQKWICKELGYSAFSEKRGKMIIFDVLQHTFFHLCYFTVIQIKVWKVLRTDLLSLSQDIFCCMLLCLMHSYLNWNWHMKL